jgi:uncharacterized protein (DUF2252 family)
MPKKLLSADERYDYGKSLREQTPLESHAEWSPSPRRKDPVTLIEEQNEDRIPWLIPVRRARMSLSPFAFYRGTARIMAHDLAGSPVSGINTQICGDAHLANFGAYASPERRLVFDLNDFDETLQGPWEWDVKRLAASFVLAGRHNGLSAKETRKVTERVVRSYRQAMEKLAGMRVVDIWNSLIEAEELIVLLERKKLKKKVQSGIKKTMTKDSMHALQKLAEEVGGKYRIRSERPLIIPVREIKKKYRGEDVRSLAMNAFEEYKQTVPDHISHLLGKYRLVDFAVKVVGVGSVGTRCFILLLEGRDRKDPLFLQIKQATKSVLEEHLPSSPYRNPARRVVEGQRLMQTVSDLERIRRRRQRYRGGAECVFANPGLDPGPRARTYRRPDRHRGIPRRRKGFRSCHGCFRGTVRRSMRAGLRSICFRNRKRSAGSGGDRITRYRLRCARVKIIEVVREDNP